MEIITSNNGIVFKEGALSITKGFNSVDYNLAGGDTVIFINSGNRETITSSKLEDFTLNGETLTTDNYDDKLKAAFYQSSGGGSSVDAYTKEETDTLLASKDTPFNNNTLYINPLYTGSIEDGSYEHPFKDFKQAVIDKAVELTQAGRRIDTFYFMPSYNPYDLRGVNINPLTSLLGINEWNLNFIGISNTLKPFEMFQPHFFIMAYDESKNDTVMFMAQELMEQIKMQIMSELGM